MHLDLRHKDDGDEHSEHAHHHHSDIKGKRLLFTVVLNAVITISEIIGGLLSNSLALLSDALHNLSDTIAVFIAYIANKLSKKESDQKRTFGYKRVEILAALFNAIFLIVICFYLFYEAYERFFDPQPIKGILMIIVAIIGLLANLLSVIILHKDKNKNINIKAAYIHLMGDTLSSVAVVISGFIILFYEVYWLDPVITVLIGLYILKETYSVLKETIDILMQAAPDSLDLNEIKELILSNSGISGIHHVHLWQLTDQNIHFECHLELNNDLKISETENMINKLKKSLHDKFHITHASFQVEFNFCSDNELKH